MNLEQKFLNAAAAELDTSPIEGEANFRGPVPPAAQLEAPVGEYVLTPDSPEIAASVAARVASGRGTAASVVGQQVPKTEPKQLTQDDVNKMIADPAYRFDSVSNQLRDIFNKEPQSELIPLNRSMREDLSYSMQQILVDKFGVDNYRAGRLADTLFGGERSGAPMGLGLVDVTPFTIPLSFQESGISAGKAFEQFDRGNYGQAALEYGTGILQSAEAIPVVGMAVKGLKAGAKSLAPNIADVMESGLRKTGMITDIVQDGKSVIKPEDIKLVQETQSDWIFELPNGTRKTIDKFEYLSDVATMGQYAPSKEQMILSAKKEVAQMAYEQANKQASKSEIGFYSAVENAAMNLQRNSGAGQSFLNDIMKGENVKPEEIKWIGLDEFLKGKKNVTKQEVQDYIANNKVDVQEVKSTVIRPLLSNGARPVVEGDKGAFLPKFGTYQLAGGENYRELLLTMPDKRPTVFTVQADSLTKEFNTMDEATAYKNSLMQQYPNSSPNIIQNKSLAPDNVNYKSSHFPDQRNILAHLRVNDRVDADGKKMLLIEEVQSDWHQAGRDIGYATTETKNIEKQFKDYSKELAAKYDLNPEQNLAMYATLKRMQPEEVSKYEQLQSAFASIKSGVPDAPFKDTWYQLALKRALQYASENGYERVGLTTGKQQIDRYSNAIRQNVDQISFYPFGTKGDIAIYARKDNKEVFNGIIKDGKFIDGPAGGFTADKVLGKSMAKQIAEKKDGVITGDNLSIGGEGMKKYYDETYPAFLDKYAKKWNAKIGETKINPRGTAWKYGLDVQDTDIPVRYMDITPEMKAGVKKGQPLFTAAPIGAATGTAAMQDERKK